MDFFYSFIAPFEFSSSYIIRFLASEKYFAYQPYSVPELNIPSYPTMQHSWIHLSGAENSNVRVFFVFLQK